METWETHTIVPMMDIWWSQVVFFSSDFILVRVFDEENNPDFSDLIMLSAETGEVLWKKPGAQLITTGEHGLMIREEGGQVLCVNPGTGNASGNYHIGSKTVLAMPWHYTQGEDYFDEVADYLSETDPVNAIDYLEKDENFIIAYYTRAGKYLQLNIRGVDSEGDIRLNERIESELSGIADPTFFMIDRNVIFVKEKQHFFVYELS